MKALKTIFYTYHKYNISTMSNQNQADIINRLRSPIYQIRIGTQQGPRANLVPVLLYQEDAAKSVIQEAANIAAELLFDNGDPYENMNYGQMFPYVEEALLGKGFPPSVVIKSIQHLKARDNDLQS
jgi:hypothetical protein